MEKFSPTLIIGLGGLGSEVIENVYRKFIAGKPSDLDKGNVRFLCLDTDENDINERMKVMPPDTVVKTSSDLSSTIGQYVDKISRRTTVLDWFDTSSRELNDMPLNDGAAQVRMASRLAMISAIDEGKLSVIENAISQLMATDPQRKRGNNVRIHIVTSIAGGTGAGTFLQMAYYVKNAMREQGAMAPKIYGYFVLPDTLIEGTKTFDKSQKTNARSNAYACIKELIAFSGSDHNQGLKAFDFEYRMGQRDTSLPAERPYNECFVMDFHGANGGNLQMLNRYKEQMASYLFLIVFGRTGGDFRSKAINNIRERIKADGTNIYASFGVSKLVYPIDDLFEYFARQSVGDNMSATWCRVDRDIQKRMDEYNNNVFLGIPDTQPDKGEEFMRNIENYSHGAGHIAAQFNHIYKSTQVLDEDNVPLRSKAEEYVDEVRQFVEDTVNGSEKLNSLAETCMVPDPNFTSRNDANDLNFVARRERELEDYKKEVFAFIDSSKQYIIRECFLVDQEAEGFVSRTPNSHRHHLNTFILEKDNEMHPLAARYFLYNVRDVINSILEGNEGKKEANRKLREQIEEEYRESFDIPETKDRTETAQQYLKLSQEKSSGFGNQVTKFFSGQNPYQAAKENYVAKSTQQAESIQLYSTEKMLEVVYSGLLDQINRLIDESEKFFDHLPAALKKVDNARVALLKKHNVRNADPSIEYVLASEQIKKVLYEKVISKSQTAFFPTMMSAAIYRTMFENVVQALNNADDISLKEQDEADEKEAAIEANKAIIQKCILHQNEYLREKNRSFVEMNAMSALKMEAQIMKGKKDDDWMPYMEERFHHFRDRAEIWGPSNLDSDVRYINSWGFNKECTAIETIDKDFADKLFGDTAVNTNPTNAASRLESDFFSPYEIVRCNTVTLLYIDKHFPQFIAKNRTERTDESLGDYYIAYHDVIGEMLQPDSKTYSPHLNKFWHLPAYMPNIGSSIADEKKKLFRAFFGGLLFGKFKAVYEGGEYYWKYQEKTWRFIKNLDGRRIAIDNGQMDALNNLFIKGLANNPNIVDQINEFVDEKWKEAKDKWLGTDRDETNELQLMKDSDIVKRIVDFRFTIHSSFPKNQNWFTLLNSRKGLALFNIIDEHKDFFFENLMDRLIDVFGACVNTKKLCKYVLGNVKIKGVKDDALALFDFYENEGRFEPTDE